MNEMTPKTRMLLTLSFLKGVGPAGLRRVAEVPYFEEEELADLLAHLPRNAGAKINARAIEDARAEADKQIELASAADVRILSVTDPDYPPLLQQTKDDPLILFVKGKLAKEPEKSVAIIGTREPTEHGKIIAERLTGFFVKEGWSVVSGLALGCDVLAHKAALAANGHTVAVLAHGLHTMAPKRHQKIADQIVESGGALVTEYAFGRDPMPTQFVKRDRIQAGLARGVVMVQSDLVGGSLHASRAAIDYDRWLAVPFPTEQDIGRREAKVQANLRLADGTPAEKIALLKCRSSDLGRLIVLRSKSDYARMLDSGGNVAAGPIQDLSQPDLFAALPAPKPRSNERVNQVLSQHLELVEDQLAVHQRGLIEHGREFSGNPHFQEMLAQLELLQASVRRVRELEMKLSEKHKRSSL